MKRLAETIFGNIEFPESEEYEEFRYKLSILALIFAGLTSSLFAGLAKAGALGQFNEIQIYVIFAHAVLMFASWLVLRGRKRMYVTISWFSFLVTFADVLSYFLLVENDAVRVFWFLNFIPGTYLLVGHLFGAVMTFVCVFGIVLANPFSADPLSPNSVATTIMSMLFFAVLHHAFAKRSDHLYNRLQVSNERLREMATRDMLTNVLNSHAYYEVSDSQIQVARRQGTPYSVLFIDLDHFKSINDTYGHAAGDHVLLSVANCLTQSLRASDVLGRVGGEEFSAFLPNTDAKGAAALAELIRSNLEMLMPSIGENVLKVTASIGVAANGHAGQTMFDLQRQADQAMYRAKTAGRNRVSSIHQE